MIHLNHFIDAKASKKLTKKSKTKSGGNIHMKVELLPVNW